MGLNLGKGIRAFCHFSFASTNFFRIKGIHAIECDCINEIGDHQCANNGPFAPIKNAEEIAN
jgi:hypothetical protein